MADTWRAKRRISVISIKYGVEFCDRRHIQYPTILVQNDLMEHRGIRYVIRIGVAREEWRVVVHIPDKRLPVERAVFGTWEDAKTEARGSPTSVAKLPEPSLVRSVAPVSDHRSDLISNRLTSANIRRGNRSGRR